MTNVVDKKLSFSEVWSIGFSALRSDYIPTLKSASFFCIFLSLIQFAVSYLPRLLRQEPMTDVEMMTHRIIEIFFGVIISIFFSIAITFGYFFSRVQKHDKSIFVFLKKNIKLVAIETFRSMFTVLLNLLLLVIPGLVKLVQLVFVPLVVQVHRSYQAGKVDALDKSKELVKGSLLGIATFYIFTQILVFGVEFALPAQIKEWMNLEQVSLKYLGLELIFVVFFGVIIEVAAAVALVKIFEKLVILKEGENELAL